MINCRLCPGANPQKGRPLSCSQKAAVLTIDKLGWGRLGHTHQQRRREKRLEQEGRSRQRIWAPGAVVIVGMQSGGAREGEALARRACSMTQARGCACLAIQGDSCVRQGCVSGAVGAQRWRTLQHARAAPSLRNAHTGIGLTLHRRRLASLALRAPVRASTRHGDQASEEARCHASCASQQAASQGGQARAGARLLAAAAA